MGFFEYLFYGVAILLTIWELFRFGGLNTFQILKDATEKAKAEMEANKKIEEAEVGDPLYLADKKIGDSVVVLLGCTFFMSIMLIHWIWLFVGLFTDQWEWFVSMLLFSFLYSGVFSWVKDKPSLATAVIRVDAFITILAFILLFVNRFHLHWF